MKRLLLYFFPCLLLVGCTSSNFITYRQSTEPIYSSRGASKYAIELTSPPLVRDSMNYSFQIEKYHQHPIDSVDIEKEILTHDNVGASFGTMALYGATIGACALIAPFLNQYCFYYIGGLGIILESINIIKLLPDDSKRFDNAHESGIRRIGAHKSTSLKQYCPITDAVSFNEAITINANGRNVIVLPNAHGAFSINLRRDFGITQLNSDSIKLQASCDKLKLKQELLIDAAKCITKRIASDTTSYEAGLADNSQNINAEYAYWSPLGKIRLDNIEAVSDQRLLGIIAENTDYFPVKKYAFNHLDKISLYKIAQGGGDPGLMLACKIRTNMLSWNEVFSKYALTPSDLRNIISAAALVESPEPAQRDIVFVCHKYIRIGEDKNIPELCDLLLRYGDKLLAEDYLNCGKAELSSAAQDWASKHGFSTETGSGSHRVRWGEGR